MLKEDYQDIYACKFASAFKDDIPCIHWYPIPQKRDRCIIGNHLCKEKLEEMVKQEKKEPIEKSEAQLYVEWTRQVLKKRDKSIN